VPCSCAVLRHASHCVGRSATNCCAPLGGAGQLQTLVCIPSDGRFLVERGDLMLIEEQPVAGKGMRRDLRPLSFQESLELLVTALHECCHMTRNGTVATLKLSQSLMPMVVRPAVLHCLEHWSRLLRLSRWHDR
jgi:hypothetical protein